MEKISERGFPVRFQDDSVQAVRCQARGENKVEIDIQIAE
jgi:hypothetical protein